MKENSRKREDVTAEARDIIDKRAQAVREDRSIDADNLTKALRKQMQKDRRKRLLDMVSKDLDVRDRWMGLKMLKKGSI